jgi:superfamily II DNA or RNA helicase
MRGIYVLHCLKPNRYYIHKVGQADNLGRRKGEYASHTFEPEFSRIYEIHDGFDLLKVEEALHNKLERLGVKVGPEWFEIEVERIDQCALDLFLNEPGPFKGALKELHLTDPTEIERVDYGSTSKASSSKIDNTETATEVEVVETIYNPILSGFTPREDQYELLTKLREHFIEQGNARGQIRLPPGYGKTQIGCCLFPIENGMKRILILVPSIKLAQETAMRVQTFHEENLGLTCFKYYQVHSDGTPYTLEEINSSEYVCIVGVYNSVGKLQGAKPFDIIIFDEAHRTSIKSRGTEGSDNDTEDETHFTFALSDDNLQAKHRLFMTATPRIINNDDNSMSNTDKYGEVIFSMTIRQAVNKHIISDYKIWMYVKAHGEELSIETDGERFALLMKFLEQCNGRKTLIVCRSIASCEFVTHTLKSKGLLDVYSVHSRMNKNDGKEQIKAFRETTSKTALCAVNMFKEGIDCPAIDSVVFYDERSSVIDVLQIVGRGLRYKPDLDYTDIGILCSVNPSQRLDEQSEMRYLRMIIHNMFDYNEEITNHLQIIKQEEGHQGKLTAVDGMVQQVRAEMKDNEDTIEFEERFQMSSNVKDYGEQHFQQARAYAQERSALFNWRDESQWLEYVENAGKDLPRDIPRRPDRVYKKMGWISWDDFLGLDEEKAFDFGTYKYVLQNNLKNNNPTSEEYSEIVHKYNNKRVVSPSECNRVYGKGFYDILESIFGPTNFTPLHELRRLKTSFAGRGLFTMQEYNNLKQIHPGYLPNFPLVFYNVTSLSRL